MVYVCCSSSSSSKEQDGVEIDPPSSTPKLGSLLLLLLSLSFLRSGQQSVSLGYFPSVEGYLCWARVKSPSSPLSLADIAAGRRRDSSMAKRWKSPRPHQRYSMIARERVWSTGLPPCLLPLLLPYSGGSPLLSLGRHFFSCFSGTHLSSSDAFCMGS